MENSDDSSITAVVAVEEELLEANAQNADLRAQLESMQDEKTRTIDLLEKELEVERKINQRRTELMEKKFNSETEQLQKLEKVREGGRESIQKYKEKRLQQREQSFKEHEQLLARYNAQINELDSKLTLTTAEEVEVRVARRASVDKRKAIDEALQQQKEKDKKCSIM